MRYLRELIQRQIKDIAKEGHEYMLDNSTHKTLILGECFYCGDKPKRLALPSIVKGSELTIATNGIDRKDNAKEYTPANCVSCCWPCNKMKGALSYEDFIYRCSSIALLLLVEPSARSLRASFQEIPPPSSPAL